RGAARGWGRGGRRGAASPAGPSPPRGWVQMGSSPKACPRVTKSSSRIWHDSGPEPRYTPFPPKPPPRFRGGRHRTARRGPRRRLPPPRPGIADMSRFFVGRPIVAMVIAILMILIGAVAMATLPIAQYPDIVPPQIQLTTTYTGADAVSVEQSVATPIEQQMSGADNLLYMQSTNANDGSFNLQVTFDVDTNISID